MDAQRHFSSPLRLCGSLSAGLIAVLVSTGVGPTAAGGADDSHSPAQATASLDVAPGLEATLFASEPMLVNPTNIDVDHLGRVWVCEVVNYRDREGTRPEGDRILILEDTDGDGRADKSTVFYEGRDIDAAMGICVLGNRVIVSVSPNIFVFTDTDGDGKADKKEVLFSKTGRPQHDHSAHKFIFGPDGCLYWNFGNKGKAVCDRNAKPLVDTFGHPVLDNGQPYRGGMVFRCDSEGRNFEVLAHNFRNPYEVAVDSFGGLWQSDNDDDGYRSVRINYLLEYGNYGFRDEMTGAAWQTRRTNLEATIPERHWHQNDPGVVPNLLITGAGAPSGMVVYEGDLLPPVFQNQLIHCDPGVNVVRSYSVETDGAGYRAQSTDILRGTRDKWFRPVDVAVAPDGSLMVADWYDPGVGGHRMADTTRGRIFRVAPPKTVYRVPKYDFSTVDGAVEALKSPNLETRYLARTALEAHRADAEPALARLFNQSPNARLRARALWILATVSRHPADFMAAAAKDDDPNLRITAIRVARHIDRGLEGVVERLVQDPSPQVRRECAVALRNLKGPKRSILWTELARRYDRPDRWYLEALGIGAEGDWDACLGTWLGKVGLQWNSVAGRDIVWRSRANRTPELLAQILDDRRLSETDALRYLRAFDFQADSSSKEAALVRLAFGSRLQKSTVRALAMTEALRRIDRRDVVRNPAYVAALERALTDEVGTSRFIELIERFSLPGHSAELLAVAQNHADDELGVRATRLLLLSKRRAALAAALCQQDHRRVERTIQALGTAEDARAVPFLWPIVCDSKQSIGLRRVATAAVGRTTGGAARLLSEACAARLDPALRDAAAAVLLASPVEKIRTDARKLFPLTKSADAKPLPSIKDLAHRTGDARKGRVAFTTIGTCSKCHVVDGSGKEVGPNLSDIGAKLSREALYESILFPSAGISHGFETHTVVLKNGNIVSGILVSRTSDEVALRGIDAIVRQYPMPEIEELKEQSVSLMPAELHKAMTEADLVNLVEYLATLRTRTDQPRPKETARVSGATVHPKGKETAHSSTTSRHPPESE
jgi:putative membrane-bound dehydrogenase-like protein